jgi:hypothetical protein
MEIVTYKEIMDKYPEAREDIERLQASKNNAVIGIWFLGVIVGYYLCYLVGYIHV